MKKKNSPHLDADGDPICDVCYEDERLFTCIRCNDYGKTEYRDSIGALFVAFDADVDPGIYEVTAHPFYADGMIEQILYRHAIRKLSGNTFGIDEGDYPISFLCERCAGKIKELIKEISADTKPLNEPVKQE